jgi:hypothetical protein
MHSVVARMDVVSPNGSDVTPVPKGSKATSEWSGSLISGRVAHLLSPDCTRVGLSGRSGGGSGGGNGSTPGDVDDAFHLEATLDKRSPSL